MANAVIDLSTLKLNDEFKLGRHQVASEDPWDLDWVVVHVDDNYLYCMTKYIIDQRCFDAKEPNNSDSNRKNYGNNAYRYANLMQWLNSTAAAGKWYTAKHGQDQAPDTADRCYGYATQYSARAGFLNLWTEDELKWLQDMTLTLANNTVTDGGGSYTWTGKVWLPTYTQMGFGNNNNVAEGVKFSKFTDNASRIAYMHPTARVNSASSSKPDSDTAAWWYWMASADTSNSYYAWVVNGGGGSNYGDAAYGRGGVRPCIKLPRSGRVGDTTPDPGPEDPDNPTAVGGTVIVGGEQKLILPSAATKEKKSAVHALASANAVIMPQVAWNGPSGASYKAYITNNAYDAAPTWEEITEICQLHDWYKLKNATKTGSKWGLQMKVVVDRGGAVAIEMPEFSFTLIDGVS